MIRDRADLAVLGGTPAFAEPLHVSAPSTGDRVRLLARINDALDRRWLTNDGPMVRELEQRLSAFLGVRHCIAMCNATVALEIGIRALGLKGEVIVPSMTFIATAHALQWQEIRPVFADVDPATHNISVGSAEAMITPRTTAIVGVHLWGRPCDVDGLTELAQRRRLRLLYDAAHAFAVSHRGISIGNFGDLEVFSFHATKFFNTFEGGAVTTNDDDLAERLRLMRNFGFEGYDRVVHVGTNGKMNEISAAMGLTLLDDLDSLLARNRFNYERYAAGLSSLKGLTLQTYSGMEQQNWQYIVVEVDEEHAGLSRDQLLEVLWRENVHARRYFYPGCHRMEPYVSHDPHAGLMLPHTNALLDRVLTLPSGSAVDADAIDLICNVLHRALTRAADVRRTLEAGPPVPTYFWRRT
jgi:dTDP-4-amino-4,6-dideoxygalactose transaminase